LEIINKARHKPNGQNLDFIALALRGKSVGFGKVIEMIENMIVNLKKEQETDDAKKEYCLSEFDAADDKKKELETNIADLETAIADAEEAITTLKTEIEALSDGIKALDKSVEEATEQRKEENEDFKALMASDAACKELIGFAKNRLNKFYNPKLYKAPPKRELTEEERITLNMGGTLAPTAAPGGIAGTGVGAFVQIRMHRNDVAAPPETFGAYKKSEESGGVIAMIDSIIKDLEKEMTLAPEEEKDAQAEYEAMMKDSAEKRAEDSKTMTDKEGAVAETEAALQQHKSDKMSTGKELQNTMLYVASLHGECDFLVANFDARKAARDAEYDALGKSKASLSGADFSLLQSSTVSRKFLRQ
jgi:septal ring factor EnvC (AmiA/AmiB activator)